MLLKKFRYQKNCVALHHHQLTQDILATIELSRRAQSLTRQYAEDPKALGLTFAAGAGVGLSGSLQGATSPSARRRVFRWLKRAEALFLMINRPLT